MVSCSLRGQRAGVGARPSYHHNIRGSVLRGENVPVVVKGEVAVPRRVPAGVVGVGRPPRRLTDKVTTTMKDYQAIGTGGGIPLPDRVRLGDG